MPQQVVQQVVPQQHVVHNQQQIPHSYQTGQQVQYQQMGAQQVPHYQQLPQQGSNVLHDSSRIHDKEHIKALTLNSHLILHFFKIRFSNFFFALFNQIFLF